MTTVKFYTKNSAIIAFEALGHASFAESGSDIVCSAISSAVGLTHCTLEDVLKISLKTEVDSDGARIYVELPKVLDADKFEKAQTALNALKMHFTALMEEYPQNIKVLEV